MWTDDAYSALQQAYDKIKAEHDRFLDRLQKADHAVAEIRDIYMHAPGADLGEEYFVALMPEERRRLEAALASYKPEDMP